MELKDIAKTLQEQGEAFEAFKKRQRRPHQGQGRRQGCCRPRSQGQDPVRRARHAVRRQGRDRGTAEEGQPPDVGPTRAKADWRKKSSRSTSPARRLRSPRQGDARRVRRRRRTSEYKSASSRSPPACQSTPDADEQKAHAAGSDPDGGYFLPHSTMGRMSRRACTSSRSCARSRVVQTISTDEDRRPDRQRTRPTPAGLRSWAPARTRPRRKSASGNRGARDVCDAQGFAEAAR
jgi:predicted phage gp36 major capsid-like protein